jgi:acyl carrier protein
MTTTFERLRAILVRAYKLDPEALILEAPLEGLGVDSLGVAELFFNVEDEFRITLPPEPVQLPTVGDVVRYIDRLVAAQHGGPSEAGAAVERASRSWGGSWSPAPAWSRRSATARPSCTRMRMPGGRPFIVSTSRSGIASSPRTRPLRGSTARTFSSRRCCAYSTGSGTSRSSAQMRCSPTRARFYAISTALDPSEVDAINAHGTRTQANDPVGIAAIKVVFGERVPRIPVSETKSISGHLFGVMGASNACSRWLAMQHAVASPTMHLETSDAACVLDSVPNAACGGVAVRTMLSISFAFGGTDADLALRAAPRGDG